MRDIRFIAEHRGGLLNKINHCKLIRWARECSEHVLPLIGQNIDSRLVHALHIAKEWEKGNVPTGHAMKASRDAHVAARESPDPLITAVSRSVGQAVATAHMADHSIGAALYARKAVKLCGKKVEAEKEWQIDRLPSEINELVLTLMNKKEKHFKI
jgi:hypothetical protein